MGSDDGDGDGGDHLQTGLRWQSFFKAQINNSLDTIYMHTYVCLYEYKYLICLNLAPFIKNISIMTEN